MRVLITIMMLLLLQGCASVRMGEQVEQGRRSFINGNYKQALHELLPAAVYGNARAQYAVGFIYYNGYEVPQDAESGIFWMTMSSKQGYAPAKQALAEIQQENLLKASKIKPVSGPKATTIFKTSSNFKAAKKDEVLQAIISDQLLHEAKKTPPTQIIAKNDPMSVPVPIAKYPIRRGNYTLQLFGSYKKNEVKSLQTKLSSSKLTRCWHTKRDGKDWFVLTYGEFKTAHAAKTALVHLAGTMREMNPWIRPIGQLELA